MPSSAFHLHSAIPCISHSTIPVFHCHPLHFTITCILILCFSLQICVLLHHYATPLHPPVSCHLQLHPPVPSPIVPFCVISHCATMSPPAAPPASHATLHPSLHFAPPPCTFLCLLLPSCALWHLPTAPCKWFICSHILRASVLCVASTRAWACVYTCRSGAIHAPERACLHALSGAILWGVCRTGSLQLWQAATTARAVVAAQCNTQ